MVDQAYRFLRRMGALSLCLNWLLAIPEWSIIRIKRISARLNMRGLVIQIYTDGDQPGSLPALKRGWESEWKRSYPAYPDITFLPPLNLKRAENHADLPKGLQALESIRNPDLFFYETTRVIEIGGVEITDHSPDGSNIEKRYPFLWAAPECRTNAFLVTRYLKKRPGGQINRLPGRHSIRNREFVEHWDPANAGRSFLRQFLPLRGLHLGDMSEVPATISKLMPDWQDLGALFADLLAAHLEGQTKATAVARLRNWKKRLGDLADACIANSTRETEASTLIKLPGRWIQVYNSRPDSGHWERGEGQFDSIDGRVMFTLDEISLLPPAERPKKFELWLPQMVSSHPWIREQRERDFGSKRLRNLLVTLSGKCTTKFADQLTQADWVLLRKNPRLVLERLDWDVGIFRVADLVGSSVVSRVAAAGISKAPGATKAAIKAYLQDPNLYYCSVRPYSSDPVSVVTRLLKQIPSGAKVLAPRLPKALLSSAKCPRGVTLVPAEDCTKYELMMLRQLHRHVKGR